MQALTEAHRRAQNRIGATTVAQMRAAWPLLDTSDLDGSFGRWLAVVVPLIQSNRRRSATTAASYAAALRALVTGPSELVVPRLADAVERGRIETSMLVTGPASLRNNLAKAMPLRRAVDIAQSRSAAAAMRHVLDGGRQTLVQAVRDDDRAVGWERVTSGKACAFCLMLAGRGAVYGADSADFEAHDGCSCSAEPVYR